MIRVLIVILTLLFFYATRAFTQDFLNEQQYLFSHFTANDGLSQSFITTMIQDDDGFLWIGTADGLNRYDGQNFISFRSNNSDSTSISSRGVYSLLVTKDGKLWIGMDDGSINLYDKSHRSFSSYQIVDNSKEARTVKALIENEDGNIWVGTASGLYLFNPVTNTVRIIDFLNERELPQDAENIVDLVLDESGNLFIGTRYWQSGLFYMDTQSLRTTHFIDGESPYETYSNVVNDLFQDENGELYVATNKAVLRLKNDWKGGNESNYEVSLNDNSTVYSEEFWTSMLIDKTSRVWFGGFYPNSLAIKEGTDTKVVDIQSQLDNKFNSLGILNIYEDRSGVIWFASNGGGLFKYAPNISRFNLLNKSLDLNSTSIRGIYTDKHKRLWIGGYGGLDVYDSQGNHRYLGMKLSSNKPVPVWCILEDKILTNTYWIGTEGDGLYKYNYNENRLIKQYYPTTFDNDPSNEITADHVISVLQDNDNTLWISTDTGIERYNEVEDKFELVEFEREFCETTESFFFKPLIDSHNEKYMWVPTSRCGIFLLDKEKLKYRPIQIISSDQNFENPRSISAIHEDGLRRLWIGTGSGLLVADLSKFDYNNNELIIDMVFDEENGLANENINGILEDEEHTIWISTNTGISNVNPFQKDVMNFGLNDGLQDLEFNRISYHRSNNGTMFFGGIQGVNSFNPSDITMNTNVPDIAILDFKIFNESYNDLYGSPIDLNKDKSISIPNSDNFISILFAAMDFTDPANNQYAYKLDGFNNDWYFSGNRGEAIYTNLNPGKYTFRIKASNNDGVWNETPKEIQIIITPPWWRTWWALSIWSILLLSLVLGLFRIRVNRIRDQERAKRSEREIEKLRELDQAKSSLFANISHEFRTPLTLILGPLNSISKKLNSNDEKEEVNMIKSNAEKLLMLVNQILELSKLQSGKLAKNLKPGDLIAHLKGLASSFESMAERKRIEFIRKFDHDTCITEFDKDQIDKIFSNILSNAFKFTKEGGKVFFELTLLNENKTNYTFSDNEIEKGWLKVTIRDTGIGIPEVEIDKIFDRFYQVSNSTTRTYEGTGIGLSYAKELINEYGGEIEVVSKEGWGTEMIIWYPMEILGVSEPESNNLEIKVEEVDREVILVVDDNVDLRNYLSKILSNDYYVLEAENGLAAFQMSINQVPDIIVSDVMMPEIDGYELTKKVKENNITSHIPVILLTAKVAEEEKIEGLKAGADSYLAKPFNEEELKIRIENLLKQRAELQKKLGETIVIKPTEIKVESTEQEFLKKAIQVVEKNMDNESFSVDDISRETGVSRAQFHRKITALTGHSTTYFIRSIRLERAKSLLEQGAGNVTEIAYSVGFNSHSYFTKSFTKYFGFPPSEIAQKS